MLHVGTGVTEGSLISQCYKENHDMVGRENDFLKELN